MATFFPTDNTKQLCYEFFFLVERYMRVFEIIFSEFLIVYEVLIEIGGFVHFLTEARTLIPRKKNRFGKELSALFNLQRNMNVTSAAED